MSSRGSVVGLLVVAMLISPMAPQLFAAALPSQGADTDLTVSHSAAGLTAQQTQAMSALDYSAVQAFYGETNMKVATWQTIAFVIGFGLVVGGIIIVAT